MFDFLYKFLSTRWCHDSEKLDRGEECDGSRVVVGLTRDDSAKARWCTMRVQLWLVTMVGMLQGMTTNIIKGARGRAELYTYVYARTAGCMYSIRLQC